MDRAAGTAGAKGRALSGTGDQGIGLGKDACDVVSIGCRAQVVVAPDGGAACGGLRGQGGRGDQGSKGRGAIDER